MKPNYAASHIPRDYTKRARERLDAFAHEHTIEALVDPGEQIAYMFQHWLPTMQSDPHPPGDWDALADRAWKNLETTIRREHLGEGPVTPPAAQSRELLRAVDGRFQVNNGQWINPRDLIEWKIIWYALIGREDLIHERCKLVVAGEGNGIQSAGQLDWAFLTRVPHHPPVQFSAKTPGYFQARQRASEIIRSYGLLWFFTWGCDTQRIYPDMREREAAYDEWITWVLLNPHVVPKAANEPWNNFGSGATDRDLLRFGAKLRDALTDGRTFCIGDPKDEVKVHRPDPREGDPLRAEIVELLRVGGPRSYIGLHPVRTGGKNDPRYARWLDHLHGFVNQLEFARQELGWPHLASHRIDESNSAAHEWVEDYRENRPLALAMGQVLGALMGGYSQMWRSEESPNFGEGFTPPGWLEGKVASIVPASPDYRYGNADGNGVVDFEGFGKKPGREFPEGKVRTLSNGSHELCAGYGAPGRIIWPGGYQPELIIRWNENDGGVEIVGEFWQARR